MTLGLKVELMEMDLRYLETEKCEKGEQSSQNSIAIVQIEER